MSALRLEYLGSHGRCGLWHMIPATWKPATRMQCKCLTSLTHAHLDNDLTTCLPCPRRLFSKITLHDCLPTVAPKPKVARCVSELRAYLGHRSLVVIALPTNTYTSTSTSTPPPNPDRRLPPPPSNTRPHTSTVAAPSSSTTAKLPA